MALLQEEFWGPDEVAAYFRLPLDSVLCWCYKNQGPRATKIGKHLRYRVSDVHALMAQQEQEQEKARTSA